MNDDIQNKNMEEFVSNFPVTTLAHGTVMKKSVYHIYIYIYTYTHDLNRALDYRPYTVN